MTRPLWLRSFAARAAAIIAVVLAAGSFAQAAEIRASTDFDGGSARVESVDQDARVIRMMPGGDPQRGWPCWWFLRLDGVENGERLTLAVAGSDLPARNNGQDTGKPLAAQWAMPTRAAFSTDGTRWQQTPPGRREAGRIHYEIAGTGGPLWVAWGPPFTPRDTEGVIAEAETRSASAKGFDLARTRGGRAVRGLRVSDAAQPARGIWVHARQHAWESGSSWVARGFIEWLTSEEPDAQWLRKHAETVVIPIMDVDNVVTGNGGKEAAPRDHNRDWAAEPHYPEIAAAQQRLREWAAAGRLDVFLDLHNPAPGDLRPFFFVGPNDSLDADGLRHRESFLACAARHITDPLALEEKARTTGPGYHPIWHQSSFNWVTLQVSRQAVAVCLETSWNTPHSTTEGYQTVGRQLGQAVADYLQSRPPP
jgi:hypothetical protein